MWKTWKITNSAVAVEDLMQWLSLGIPSEGKFHSAAAKMEVRFKNHVGKKEIFRFILSQPWL